MPVTQEITHTLNIDVQLSTFKSLENNSDLTCMILLIRPINKNVINKLDNKQIEVWFKHNIHEVHECCESMNKKKT